MPWHRTLEARVAVALGLLVAAAVSGVLMLTIGLVSRESRVRAEAGLESARTAFYSLLDSRAASAAALAQLVTELPVFRAHLTDTQLSADRATITQMTDAYRLQLGAAFAIVIDSRGRWLANPGWSHAGAPPPALAAPMASALEGQAARAIVDRGGELFLVVSLPARFAEEVLGALVVGFVLNDSLAQELARLAQCEVVLVAGGRVAATSLRARAHSDTTALAADAFRAEAGVLPELRRVASYQYVGGTFPLWSGAKAADVGRLVLLADWQPTQQFIDQLRERFLLGGGLVFGFALAGGLVFSRRVSRPLRDIALAATDIAGGNLELQLPVGGTAEEASVARAFNEMSSSLRTAHDRLVHDAIHDPLTQLPNRILFMERLDRAMARRARHPDYRVAVLFIDLDRFKHVNDSLGHAVGDQLLVQFAARLATIVRRDDVVSRLPATDAVNPESNTLARFGGDEFVVLLDDIREPIDAVRVAERVQQMAAQPLQVGAQEIFACPSIGVTVSSADHASGAEILRDADLAMHRAKSAGGGCYAVFDARMHEAAVERLQLETEIRRATERGELRLCYQPIVSLASREVAGFEALVRWQHAERGLLQPAAFLGVAEETGVILQIDEWALAEACRQGAAWARRRPGAPLTMSVNLSARALGAEGLLARVAEVLRTTGFPASALRLEVTEGVAVADPVRVRSVLQGLRTLGVRVSLDDFGTGYCSLSYLQQFPVDTLKIDRSFVARIGGVDGGQAEIIRLIVSLARTLGLDVVAEGTETEAQVDYLASLGCGYGQGYYFARPQLASEIAI